MRKSNTSKSYYVEEAFTGKKTITLSELYVKLENEFPDMDKKDLRHNVRSIINTMRQSGQIKRVGPRIWQKI